MKEIKITRKTIKEALEIMVATAPTFDTFVRYFFDYTLKLTEEKTNYMLYWDAQTDIFEIYNFRSKKSLPIDLSKEMERIR